MKRAILISVLFYCVTAVNAQKVDVHGIYGWQWGGKVDGYDPITLRAAEYRVEAAEYWGAGLDVVLPNDITVQLIYTTQSTVITKNVSGRDKTDLTEANIDYWQIGGLRTLPLGKIEPYGGLLLGLAVIRPTEPGYSSTTKFAVGLKGGIKIWLTDRLGIKGELGMQLPMQGGGFSFGCGGGGCGTGVSTYTTIVQGQVGGGVVLRLKDD